MPHASFVSITSFYETKIDFCLHSCQNFSVLILYDILYVQVWEIFSGQDCGAGLHLALLSLRSEELQQAVVVLAQKGLRRNG